MIREKTERLKALRLAKQAADKGRAGLIIRLETNNLPAHMRFAA
jgi:hypothetical protein